MRQNYQNIQIEKQETKRSEKKRLHKFIFGSEPEESLRTEKRSSGFKAIVLRHQEADQELPEFFET